MSGYQVHRVAISKLTASALADMNLSTRFVDKTKNFFALGLMYWMYNRPIDQSIRFIQEKFGGKDPQVAEANLRVLKAGYNYGDTTEIFTTRYDVKPAKLPPGNTGTSWATSRPPSGSSPPQRRRGSNSSSGATRSRRQATSCTSCRSYKEFGVKTFQAEDEIAAICSAIGASYAGALGATTTSGPGLALKTEALGLAVMLELPLVVVNVQRGGPSTGLPTKTEQADLLQAVQGRNGEAPLCVVAASTPADCFSYRLRGCPDRHQVHDSGHLPDRRLPGQRRGTVADPECRATFLRSR